MKRVLTPLAMLAVACLTAFAGTKPDLATQKQEQTIDVGAIQALKAEIAQVEERGGDASGLYQQLDVLYGSNRSGGQRLDQGGETAANATVISSLPYSDTGTTTGHINDYDPHCASSNAPDVVYSYTPGSDVTISFSTCGSSYDTQIAIFDHVPGTWSMPLACNDDWCGLQSGIEGVQLTGGHTYYIIIDGFSSSNGDYVLQVVYGTVPPGLNGCGSPVQGGETIASAVPISTGTVCGNTDGMSNDYNPPCFISGGPDAVYSYTPSYTGTITVSLCGSMYDTGLNIMDSGGSSLACNDDYCGLQSQIVNFPVTSGQTYYISVDGYGSSSHGEYFLHLERDALGCPTAGELFANCQAANAAINDYDSTFVSRYVPLAYQVADVNVGLSLTHTFDGDLIITLLSPTGTRVILSNRHGGGSDDYHCTVFDDEASTPISQGTGPFEGEFIPDEPLSAFDGEGTQGSWTLIVSDNAGADQGTVLGFCVVLSPVSLPVTPGPDATVTDFALHQNYPNPFNPQTSITFDMATAGHARLEVFNTLGQSVAVLYDGTIGAGPHVATFDASGLPSGLYFYRLQAGQFSDLKKMVLMK